MALQEINIGASPNDGSGDPLRTAMDKINDNFAVLDNVINVHSGGDAGSATTLDITDGVLQNWTLDDDTAFTFSASTGQACLALRLVQDATGGWMPTINGVDVSEHINPLPYSTSVFVLEASGSDITITPKGVMDDCPIFLDFINDDYYIEGIKLARHAVFLTQRASAATYVNSAVALSNFAAGILRVGDLGALIEPNRTNVVLYNRDFTNAAWTKSNVTAAKDQTGPTALKLCYPLIRPILLI